jgi:hypothetical protein
MVRHLLVWNTLSKIIAKRGMNLQLSEDGAMILRGKGER